MPYSSHVLFRCHLRTELPSASLAFEDRGLMICVVHVLLASTLGTEGTSAGLAFGPVVIVVHVVLAIILAVKGFGAGLALVLVVIVVVHLGNG
jgi:hypothetical protein